MNRDVHLHRKNLMTYCSVCMNQTLILSNDLQKAVSALTMHLYNTCKESFCKEPHLTHRWKTHFLLHPSINDNRFNNCSLKDDLELLQENKYHPDWTLICWLGNKQREPSVNEQNDWLSGGPSAGANSSCWLPKWPHDSFIRCRTCNI